MESIRHRIQHHGDRRKRDGRAGLLASGALSAILSLATAHAAWDFVPTASEYQAWPEYCRVQFTLHGDVFSVPNGTRYPSATIDMWRQLIGGPFEGLHHYCASIHFLSRGRALGDSNERQFVLHRALADAMFSFAPADPNSVVYPDMAVTVAQIRMELNSVEEAEEALLGAIKAQPTRIEPYVMLALIQRKAGKLELARDTLLEADKVSGGASAEIQYNLGLINLDLGDIDAATENAERAYSAGYPLQGLKRRLEKAKGGNRKGDT